MSQQKLPLAFGMSKRIPEPTPQELFLVKREGDAWLRGLLLSGRNRKAVAQEIGIDLTTLSKVFNDERTMPKEYRKKFYAATGNKFPAHWIAFDEGGRLVEREETPEEELDRLRRENALLAQQRA